LQAQSNFFIIKERQFYKKDKYQKGRLLKVLQQYELEPILYLTHNYSFEKYFSKDIMFHKIRNIYY